MSEDYVAENNKLRDAAKVALLVTAFLLLMATGLVGSILAIIGLMSYLTMVVE